MALVNPQIAMSYRPTVEYQPRNALAEYAQIQNIIGGQRQAEVAEMQLDQLRQDRDALSQIQAAIVAKGGPPDLGAAADAMIRSGRPQYIQQGLTIRDTLRKQKLLEDYEREYSPGAAAPSAVPAAAAAAAAPAEGAANALAPAAAAPTTVNAMRAAAQPDVNALMTQYRRAAAAGSPDAPAILKQIEAALRGDQSTKVSPGEVVINRSGQVIYAAPASATLSDRFVPVGNLVFDRQTQQYIAPTEAQRLQQQAPRAPVAVLQNGRPVYVTPEQAVGQTPFTPASVQVLGMGPGREPPAPTITQIQDPTDPSRMITIDARRYQGGGVGSPGVIGASGKSAPAQAAAVKQQQGLTKADDILTQLQSAYTQLKERKAIPSEQTSALTNIWASIAASGIGQVAGRTVGTAAQTQRDIIQSSRNQLLLAIKDATGLSAQQLNSNMELQTWLSSLTDPTRSIEANEAILQNVRKFIDSGGKYTARGGAGAGATPTPAGRGAATGGRDLGNGFKLVD